MNAVTLIGNAGNDAEVLNFEKSKKVSFSLATNERYNKGSEQITETQWHNIIAWGKVAEQCEALVRKGKFIKVEGKITYRHYTNKENKKVYLTEIQAIKIEEMTGEESKS
jgi:single-strand DNA-binding protein